MHKTIAEGADFLNTLHAGQWPAEREVVICPAFPSLFEFQGHDVEVSFGAQTMHWADQGAFTGEVSPMMLKDVGCVYVLLGHSERRQYNAETDETVNKKVLAALTHKLKPIICVGSDSEDVAVVKATVTKQLTAALVGVNPLQYEQIAIAYEPIWAIGTGKTATPNHAQTVHAVLRELVGDQVRLLYGGSVNEQNATQLMAQKDVDGLLVGGASLKVDSFVKILNY
jgi:triosephosphate isomerase